MHEQLKSKYRGMKIIRSGTGSLSGLLSLCRIPVICLAAAFLAKPGQCSPLQRILLASKKQAQVEIVLPAHPTVTALFATSELAAYLRRISNASFPVVRTTDENPAIRLQINGAQEKEEYSIQIRDHSIFLSGGSDRALLFAVYNFLHQLGCLWLAPELSYYKGHAEYIPRKTELYYESSRDIHAKPRLTYRKLDVEEGRSHTAENLKEIINWMPKLGFNTLMVPLDYGGWGKVKWDNWRKALTPELKKRGLLIEVGGHGYQNFLNAAMEDSTLFKRHPDWFGKNRNCQPTPDPYSVFNTANPDAVQYLISQVLKYLQEHPEIDIFDFWPPDGARWADCKELVALGSPLDRQARLINQVDSAIRKMRPDIKLEMIAYQPVLDPPGTVSLNPDILVDFCPINQQFENQIFDSSSANNLKYATSLHRWRKTFAGDIGIYSYYRKYAWRSLPNLIPHYMQRDLNWYAGLPVQGISSYAEPGDWLSYELNHFVLGHLAWNPAVNVDTLISIFCRGRYGPGWETARTVYAALENTVRFTGNIPYTVLKPADQIAKAEKELQELLNRMSLQQKKISEDGGSDFSKLQAVVRYAIYDLQIQQLRTADPAAAREKVEQMLEFLEASRDQGLFILPARNVLSGFLKRYGVPPGR
jgi:hypothetical protein